jgi:predicted O-methyltransferase YrrM
MSYPEYIENSSTGRRFYRDACEVDGVKHGGGYGVRSDDAARHLEKLAEDHVKPHMIGLEVGCHTGISTEIFAKSCKRIYAIDLWPNNMIKLEDVFDFRTKNYNNIIKMKGDSDNFHEQFKEESLDFIYVDGGHAYERVVKDLRNWAPKVRMGGLIMGHDYSKGSSGWIEVAQAVDNTIGVPEILYKDNSFVIKKNDF